MKLSKFLTLTFSITLFALLYVYQQTEIFCLAYKGGQRVKAFQELLDKNNILRYNINVVTSLPHMGNKILADSTFEIPDSHRLVKINLPQEKKGFVNNIPRRLTALFDFFSLKAQAEARTIK